MHWAAERGSWDSAGPVLSSMSRSSDRIVPKCDFSVTEKTRLWERKMVPWAMKPGGGRALGPSHSAPKLAPSKCHYIS